MKRIITKPTRLDDVYLFDGDIIEINPHTCHISGANFKRYFDYSDINKALQNSTEVTTIESKPIESEQPEICLNDYGIMRILLDTAEKSETLEQESALLLTVERLCRGLRKFNKSCEE